MRGWSCSLVAVVALALAASACTRSSTQLIVRVESDLEPSDRLCVHVAVAEVGAEGPALERVFHTAVRDGRPVEPRGQTPFSFGVTAPRSDPRRRVELTVTAMRDAAACERETVDPAAVTVVRRVRTGFLVDQSLLLPIFLDRRCSGTTCDPDQTCEGGSCVAVPDIAPATLTPVVPGTELEVGLVDASGPDTAAMDDSGQDAGVDPRDADLDAPRSDTGPPFAATLPGVRYSLPTAGPFDPVYPVGVSGADRVLVAGLATRDVMVGSMPVAGSTVNQLFLAKLSPFGSTDWVLSLPVNEPFPVPLIERAVQYPGGYLACGTAHDGAFDAMGARLSCAGLGRCAFVARLATTGALESIRVIDATNFGVEDSDTRCTDLSIRGTEAMVSIRTVEAAELRVDGVPVAPSLGILEPTGGQSLVTFSILNAGAPRFTLEAPQVVGHDVLGRDRVLGGEPGTRLFTRPVGTTGWMYASRGERFDTQLGATTQSGIVEIRIERAGDLYFRPAPILDGNYPTNSLVELESMEVLDPLDPLTEPMPPQELEGRMWVAVTVTPNAGATGQEIEFGSGLRFAFDRRTTYIVWIDPWSGRPQTATPVSTSPQLAGEDTSYSHDRPLTGGGLAVTERGEVLFAAAAMEGDLLGTFDMGGPIPVMGVGGEFDALLPILTRRGDLLAAWQWTARMEPDVRLTHVEWIPGSTSMEHVAVAGYVEEQTGTSWARASSFFEIYPTR